MMAELANKDRRAHGTRIVCSCKNYDAIRELEKFLGDPNDPTRPFSFNPSLQSDVETAYPQNEAD
jgi:hypothetical protein